jgi:hypothetical protein
MFLNTELPPSKAHPVVANESANPLPPAMKTTPSAAVITAALALAALACPRAFSQATNLSIPIGKLAAFPTMVQSGAKPNLAWNISYPSVVKDYVTVTPPGTITPKQNLICTIRVLGAGVTTQNSTDSINFIRTKGQIRFSGSSSWATVFDGKQTDLSVQHQEIIKTYNVTSAMVLNFQGQYYYNNDWSTIRSSTSGTYVKALVNGDVCPSRVPDYNAPSLERFLKPYLDASKKIRIGPMDVIIFMELTHANLAEIGYDEQDLVLLVTFRTP